MRVFSLLAALAFVLVFGMNGCSKKSTDGAAVKMHWDRDMCERCKMAISERKYAVQVVNPKTGKVYRFDDIGCAVLWFDEEHIPWKNQAKIWITDAKTGKWIDARTAKYTDDSITPMAYGLAAFTEQTFPAGHQAHDLKYATDTIHAIEKLNQEKLKNEQTGGAPR